MDQLTIEELEYSIDSAPLFECLLDLEQPVYLDSARPFSTRGRYDILAAEPINKITLNLLNTVSYGDNLNYFEEVRRGIEACTPPIANDYHLPFIGGALGHFGYDLGHQLENLPFNAARDIHAPDAEVGLYSWAVIFDHRQRRAMLIAHPQSDPRTLREVRSRIRSQQTKTLKDFRLSSKFESNLNQEAYQQAFEAVQRYISSGDCYQINLAQRFSASFEGSPWHAYKALRKTAAAPFSAFIQASDYAFLSVSPERFLQTANQRVITSPIKGTIGRSSDRKSDMELAKQLLDSPKDRAENLMIVDLMRNDLGKCCIPGSIHVDELFELQSFDTVHHLVSTISGQLKDQIGPTELLAHCFPGGSITGAPKIRAMEIIEELEPHRRSIFCGSIGYISCDGQMDTNIAIRTMACAKDQIYCWAGGGIVVDSDCESEYQECYTKVDKLMAALASN